MDFLTDEMRRNPYPLYDRMRESSPALHVPGPDLWMIFDYEGVKQALHDHEVWSSDVAPSRGIRFEWLLFMDPPRHTHLRAILSRAFTPRSIANLEPRVREIARDLLGRVLDRGEMDLAADFAVPLPMMVIAEMLGAPSEDWPRLKEWSDAIVGLASTILGSEEAARGASEVFGRADEEMKGYLERLVAERREAPRDDLLTRLVEAEVDGHRLGEGELLRFVQLLLAAGTETTTNLLDNAVLCLTENPAELARLRARPELLPSAIEEVLRYRSPGQAMFRVPRRDVTLHGQVIPAGKLVLALIGSANRDPRHFEDAHRFDVARDPNPHVAFGHGIHFCLGAPLSRLEGRVGLGELLAHTRSFERASDAPWEPREAFHVHGPTRLPIRFEPVRPAAVRA
jgi:cytochrome P450